MAVVVCAVMPRVRIGSGTFVLSRSPRIVLASLPFCVWWHDAMRDGGGGVCYEWRGVWNCVLFYSSSFPFTVFAVTVLLVCGGVFLLGLCHCGMAVCEGAKVCMVSLLCLLCLCLCLFLLFVLVFGVVRAQPCEHARYPRTPLCPLLPVVCFSSFFCSSPFFTVRLSFCLEWRCVFTMCRCAVSA